MCTVVVSVSPGTEVPVVLAGLRDEFLDRRWRPPRAHWSAWPGLLGGLDLQAGGTWLAVDTGAPRVAAVLNGRGRPAPDEGRRTRGELPLRAAAVGDLDLAESDLRRFDPFHVVLAEPEAVRLWSWDGSRAAFRALTSGVHMVTSVGLDMVDAAPRVAYFLPRFQAVPPPVPAPRAPARQAWGAWRALVDGDELDVADERAIVVRDRAGEREWGSTSATLVALRATGVRYDFSPRPGDAAAWETVFDQFDQFDREAGSGGS